MKSQLNVDQEAIINNAIDFQNEIVSQHMISWDKCLKLGLNQTIDNDFIQTQLRSHSRVTVVNKDH